MKGINSCFVVNRFCLNDDQSDYFDKGGKVCPSNTFVV